VLCTGYGLVPNIELARLLGCETRDGAIVVDAQQRTTVANVLAAGEATGIGGAPLSLIEGEIAGLAVSPRPRVSNAFSRKRASLQAAAERMLGAFALRDELRALPSTETVVCRCEDVSYGSVKNAACARQAKLYTRVGMGPCQGRTCMPGLDFLLAWQPDTIRPPIEPALVSVLSSELADNAAPSILFNSSVGEAYQ
jgi:D-hydroxyproline dehydrogenase subunit alpha